MKFIAQAITVFFFLVTSSLVGQSVLAEDVSGSSDHPMVSRYDGSSIIDYDFREFDEYEILLGKVVHASGEPDNRKVESSEILEGKVTRISYYLPEDRSTLEVFRNYEDALKAAGFEILFTCSKKECGGRPFNHEVVKYSGGFADNYSEQRFLAAKLARNEGDVYVSLYIVKNTSGGGKDRNHIYTQVDVIEVAPMQEAMVTVDADAMAEEIFETGSISIYGILFDFDKADIKPESAATIEEIATLLNNSPDLKLFIVGHTDNKGSLDYNMNLSQKRAGAVVDVLITEHGIETSRLTPKGLGFLAPVDSNKSEEGRAKNRRVELVEY
jgi:outer membrane protein OmpA-like peptidoglycan-associated protein